MRQTRDKHVDALKSEIKSLRGWLDYLERDLNNNSERGVISAIVMASISESCMKLTYNAGIANGASLSHYDNDPINKGETGNE